MAVKKKVKKTIKSKSKPARKVAKARRIAKPVAKKRIAKTVVKKSRIKADVKSPKKIVEKKSIKLSVKPTQLSAKSAVVPSPSARRQSSSASEKNSAKQKPAAKSRQILSPAVLAERRTARLMRSNQTFAYMKPPGLDHAFDVGDIVEVYCDHEKNRERIRGWVRGIVVQVDHKMVAVQFRSNVFLTDGWMVPDRILWYPLTSEQIRATDAKKNAKLVPDY